MQVHWHFDAAQNGSECSFRGPDLSTSQQDEEVCLLTIAYLAAEMEMLAKVCWRSQELSWQNFRYN